MAPLNKCNVQLIIMAVAFFSVTLLIPIGHVQARVYRRLESDRDAKSPELQFESPNLDSDEDVAAALQEPDAKRPRLENDSAPRVRIEPIRAGKSLGRMKQVHENREEQARYRMSRVKEAMSQCPLIVREVLPQEMYNYLIYQGVILPNCGIILSEPSIVRRFGEALNRTRQEHEMWHVKQLILDVEASTGDWDNAIRFLIQKMEAFGEFLFDSFEIREAHFLELETWGRILRFLTESPSKIQTIVLSDCNLKDDEWFQPLQRAVEQMKRNGALKNISLPFTTVSEEQRRSLLQDVVDITPELRTWELVIDQDLYEDDDLENSEEFEDLRDAIANEIRGNPIHKLMVREIGDQEFVEGEPNQNVAKIYKLINRLIFAHEKSISHLSFSSESRTNHQGVKQIIEGIESLENLKYFSFDCYFVMPPYLLVDATSNPNLKSISLFRDIDTVENTLGIDVPSLSELSSFKKLRSIELGPSLATERPCWNALAHILMEIPRIEEIAVTDSFISDVPIYLNGFGDVWNFAEFANTIFLNEQENFVHVRKLSFKTDGEQEGATSDKTWRIALNLAELLEWNKFPNLRELEIELQYSQRDNDRELVTNAYRKLCLALRELHHFELLVIDTRTPEIIDGVRALLPPRIRVERTE